MSDIKRRMLIIEDDSMQREILCLHLEHQFSIKATSNGNDGLKIALTHKPHVVLLDSHIPGIEPKQLCQKLNIDSKYGFPKIIIMTGQAYFSQHEIKHDWMLNYHAQDVIFKPFELQELNTILGTLTY